jgi:hypothetical protein
MAIVFMECRRDSWPGAAIAMVGSSTAQNAVVRGKHVTQLGNPSSQTGVPFDQVYFKASFGQIKRGTHTTYAAANH